MESTVNETVSQRWSQMVTNKQAYMTRAEQYSRWTVSSVFPHENYTGEMSLDCDWESVGAQAVNNLANKIMLALFAPARPFFRLEADEEGMHKLVQELGVDEVKIKMMFSRAEQAAIKHLISKSGRTALAQLCRHLVIVGNGMLYLPSKEKKDQKAMLYSLRDYCVERNVYGKMIELIICEEICYSQLDEKIQQELKDSQKVKSNESKVKLYTWCKRANDGSFIVSQYADDIEITSRKERGKYKEAELPWIPVTWNLARGANYGTGHVEEYQGEFHTIDVLQQSLVEGAAVAAELKFLVNPNGVADVEELNNAEQGDYVWGAPDDINVLNVDKVQDWSTLQAIISSAEQRIGRGFLLGSSVTRDAERVTAEEIRRQAQELEQSLGGVYSHLAEELQRPVAYNVMKDIDLHELQGVEPIITTGMDSLSRGSEHEQFMSYLNDLSILNGIPEDVRQIMALDATMTKMATGRGVKYEDIIKSAEQQQADQQQAMAQQQAMMQAEAQAKQQGNQ